MARGATPVAGTAYSWPIFSDGQATFGTADGGWILATNHEWLAPLGAGSSAIRFDRDGRITDAYRILGGTNVNCGGGPTPWGTWLSCEEYDAGLVLEVAADGAVGWRSLTDPTPSASDTPTRGQVPEMTRFAGGEGIWHAGGVLYFTTKGDKKVWAYDARAETIEVLFDRSAAPDSSLDAVDNVTVSAAGEVFVCEDGGNMEMGLITPDRLVSPFLRFSGAEHAESEVCGVVFDPSGRRLYCTSQGAYTPAAGQRGPGAVYEISGPFRLPVPGTPPPAFGPPAGERPGPGPLARPRAPAPTPGAKLTLRLRSRIGWRELLQRGYVVEIETDAAFAGRVVLDSADLVRRPGRGGSSARPKPVVLAQRRVRLARSGKARVRLRLDPRARRLVRRRRRLDARVIVSGRNSAGRSLSAARIVRVGRRT